MMLWQGPNNDEQFSKLVFQSWAKLIKEQREQRQKLETNTGSDTSSPSRSSPSPVHSASPSQQKSSQRREGGASSQSPGSENGLLESKSDAADSPAGEAKPSDKVSATSCGMRQAFEQLRDDLSEQRREANRLRNNRTQLHNALD